MKGTREGALETIKIWKKILSLESEGMRQRESDLNKVYWYKKIEKHISCFFFFLHNYFVRPIHLSIDILPLGQIKIIK